MNPDAPEITRIVLHGEAAATYQPGLAEILPFKSEIRTLPDDLTHSSDKQTYISADVIVGLRFNRESPMPAALKLFHVPGTGYDGIDLAALPSSTVVCNCFGHEQAISEYVMTALLMRQIPIHDADQRLRTGEWAYRSGPPETVHPELAGKTIGLLGFGHIGKAIAVRAKAFEMRVHVANRSRVPISSLVDEAFLLEELNRFWPSADFFVIAVPLTPETRDIVGTEAFSAMRSSAVVINVGRGPTIDEKALFQALQSKKIAGAIIDTWYNYPTPTQPNVQPANLPFYELSNIMMTPHMSGWSTGTVRRRQHTMATNIVLRMTGESCLNVVWPVP
jgi:phosphoglycerate dehydrogenase-like enzyme